MKFKLSTIGFLVFGIMTSTVQAVDVAYEGYFRSRYQYFYNLDMDRDAGPNGRGFTDIRFRLNPTFFVSDKVRIRSSLNFMDGILGDNPFRVSPYSNPALATNRQVDPNETGVGDVLGRQISTSSSYGGYSSTDGMTRSAGLIPLQVRRLWGELETPYGTLKVGRMPHQFGYGIYANAGDEPTQEVGDSRDRIVFDTSFGSYYVRPGIGWLVEGALDDKNDDYNEWFFVFGRKTDNQDVGFYLSYNAQKRAMNNTANGALANSESNFWAFDFIARRNFGTVDIGAEMLLVTGDISNMSILAVNTLSRAEILFGALKVLAEVGYSSGTSEANLNNSELKTFAFSRDYDVSLIVFEEAIPGGSTLRNSSLGGADNIATAPHSGAISNAAYPRIRLDYNSSPNLKLGLNLISPFAMETPDPIAGRWYGVEYDLLAQWAFSPYWSMDFAFAQFFPGSFYKNLGASDSVVLTKFGVTAKF